MLPIINKISTYEKIIFIRNCFPFINRMQFKEEKQDIKDKPITDLSIYNLPEKWTNQDGKDIELKN